MTTIVNPGGDSSDSASLGLILGVVLTIAIIGLFVVFGLPRLNANLEDTPKNTIDVNVTLPTSGSVDDSAPKQ